MLLRDEQSQLLPKKSEAFVGQRVVAVTAGGLHNLALTADGSVWSWGSGVDGKLGHGDRQTQLLPIQVEALAGQRVVAVSAGGSHSLALTTDGAVWSWGGGIYGRLGHGNQQNQVLTKKIEAFAGRRVVAVSAGGEHSLAITADGSVWSWGRGEDGRLGHGDELRQLLPKKIEAFLARRVLTVSAGSVHTLAFTATGAVFAWGQGETGCLGHGEDLSNQLLPKEIEGWASHSAFGGMQLFATEAWRAAPLLLTRSAQMAQPTVRLPQLSQRWARLALTGPQSIVLRLV